MTVEASSSNTVQGLKARLGAVTSIHPRNQRLLFGSLRLSDHETLEHVGIENGSVLHLIEKQGFTAFDERALETYYTIDDPFTPILFGPAAAPDASLFLAKIEDEYLVDPEDTQACFHDPTSQIFSPLQRDFFMKFIDEAQKLPRIAGEFGLGQFTPKDVKINVHSRHADLIFTVKQPGDQKHNGDAKDMFCPSHLRKSNDIQFRMIRGPQPAAMGWHMDGKDPLSLTSELLLNNDFTGGHSLYFSHARGLEVLERQAGSLTRHGPRAFNAMSCVKGGARYSICHLDTRKKAGLWLTREEINTILAAISPPAPPAPPVPAVIPQVEEKEEHLCVICRTNKPEILLVPCGHLCLCRDDACTAYFVSEEDERKQCPVCRTDIDFQQRVYLC